MSITKMLQYTEDSPYLPQYQVLIIVKVKLSLQEPKMKQEPKMNLEPKMKLWQVLEEKHTIPEHTIVRNPPPPPLQ